MLYTDLMNTIYTGIVLGVAEDLRAPKAGTIRCNLVKDPTDNIVRLHITKWGEKQWEVILPFNALEAINTNEKSVFRMGMNISCPQKRLSGL